MRNFLEALLVVLNVIGEVAGELFDVIWTYIGEWIKDNAVMIVTYIIAFCLFAGVIIYLLNSLNNLFY